MKVNCETCVILKKKNSKMLNNMNRLKESYDVLNKAMNMYNDTSEEQATTMKTLQGAFMRIETERVNRLLKSYSCSSYVIDRIYPTAESLKAFEDNDVTEAKKVSEEKIEEKTPVEKTKKKKDTEKTTYGKKQGVSYNKCPPPLENGYLARNPNDERVKKATNLQWESELSVNLPNNIDVVFTSSDTDQQSQLMKKVVDHVLDNDETEESKSESVTESKSESSIPSQTEKQGKRVYNNEFLLSKSNLNDEPFKVAYTLNDSDKLYSDEEFPIRGVKNELIKKVFKLTEINISEIKELNLNCKPKPYTSRVQQRLNKKKGYSSGSSFQKKSNHNGNFKKKGLRFTPTEKQKNEKYIRDFKSKMTFISRTSSEEVEEKKAFWRQSNNEFLAKKQDEMKKMAEDCSKAIAPKQGVSRKLKNKVIEFEPPLDRTKLFKNSKFEFGQCSNSFYKKRVKSDNLKWVVKKSVDSTSDDSNRSKSEELSSSDETDSIKSVEPHVISKCEAMLKAEKSVPIVDDENFPSPRAENYKKKIDKVEISNQFYNDNQVFGAEKAFNPKVKHIFGKMVDRKVKGVKEFYEKKRGGKKPSDGDSVTPKAGEAWVDVFFE
ncbi:hypothetical protein Hanom_Chr07g00617651 [Helianthus anomalus]